MKNIYLSEINWNFAARNIFFLLRKEIKELMIEQRQATVYNSIMVSALMSKTYREKYRKEIENLVQQGRYSTYPSQQIKHQSHQAFFDKHWKLPYVMHNNKKLYFPKSYSLSEVEKCYLGYIYNDGFLGDSDQGAPHQYQSKEYCVKTNDILVDIGCAEGLFALDVIEKVSKVYLLERDPKWGKALKATFTPYAEKVIVINKLVSNKDTRNSITLNTLLRDEKEASLFIKMDIEGYEQRVIESCQSFLKQNIDVVLSCCTYHHNKDAENLEDIFEKLAYQTEFSNGYMLFSRYDQAVFPYFRHGVIRAKRTKE